MLPSHLIIPELIVNPNHPCPPPALGFSVERLAWTDILQLVIPKHHGSKLTDIPDDQLSEILPVVKKLAHASGAENYNILQNNGRLAHQVVEHVRKIPASLGVDVV